MADYYQALTTVDSHEVAQSIAASAVRARLAACAQVVGPITSVYWWNSAVHREQEWQVILKTTAEKYPALEEHLREVHSYDEPEIIAIPIVAGSEGYLDWITQETAAS